MIIKSPKIGPLIGHVTDSYVNIWQSSELTNNSNKLYGFALVNNKLFKIQLKAYDYFIGVLHVDDLKANVIYDIKIGSIELSKEELNNTSDEELKNKINMSQEIETLKVKTMPDVSFSDKTTIVLISCHYPEPLGKSDKMFKLMMDILDNKETNNTPLICHVGDQIYADQLNRHIPLRRADTADEFKTLYENKYNGKYFSQFIKKYPSIMTLDDHEIEDNWSMDRISKNNLIGINPRDLFSMAINAYKLYQASHSPLYENLENSRLWYTFNIGIYPFFVLDTRTERFAKDGHLLGKPNMPNRQIDRLCSWLKNLSREVPKFIISSVIFVPVTHDDATSPKSSDNWSGFPTTREHLLKFIVDNDIQKVIFLSGDVHNSLGVTITLEPTSKTINPIKMYQIISSPVYWPFPFADGDLSNYILDSSSISKISRLGIFSIFMKKESSATFKFNDSTGKAWKMNYVSHLDSYTQQNNFAVIDFDKNELDVKWYGYAGENNLLASHKFDLKI